MSRLERISEREWQQRALEAKGCVVTLARKCGVSSRQLQRFFRTRWNRSPAGWLNDIRIARAPGLISSGMTMKEVAADLGYKDAGYFTKEFKARYGILPSRWTPREASMSHFDEKCRISTKFATGELAKLS